MRFGLLELALGEKSAEYLFDHDLIALQWDEAKDEPSDWIVATKLGLRTVERMNIIDRQREANP